jgi:SAM-dependent methyltransferase
VSGGPQVRLPASELASERRRSAAVFDAVAEDYDRYRPRYPEALVDRAVRIAALEPGAAVLEIGSGTGQLTRSLLARGLRVTAVEPGAHLLERAQDQLAGSGRVQFINARLEDASLPKAHFAAAFSASAIHWVDPEVGWGKLAEALADHGNLALLSYFGLEDPRSSDDQQALRLVLGRISPELAAEWPVYRTLEETVAGVEARCGNVSEAWAWLGGYAIARDYAEGLFDEVRFARVPAVFEHTAQELNAMLGTMSFWARLSAEQRDALIAGNQALHQRVGRPVRSSTLACLLTARLARHP